MTPIVADRPRAFLESSEGCREKEIGTRDTRHDKSAKSNYPEWKARSVSDYIWGRCHRNSIYTSSVNRSFARALIIDA